MGCVTLAAVTFSECLFRLHVANAELNKCWASLGSIRNQPGLIKNRIESIPNRSWDDPESTFSRALIALSRFQIDRRSIPNRHSVDLKSTWWCFVRNVSASYAIQYAFVVSLQSPTSSSFVDIFVSVLLALTKPMSLLPFGQGGILINASALHHIFVKFRLESTWIEPESTFVDPETTSGRCPFTCDRSI